jgi:hypothetical protein
MNKWILLFMLFLPLQANGQLVAWTGMKTEKLLVLSEQGDRGFQYAMIYILGVVDGLEGQRRISYQFPCRQDKDVTNQQIALEVIDNMRGLDKPNEPAGKLAIHSYLSIYCINEMYE